MQNTRQWGRLQGIFMCIKKKHKKCENMFLWSQRKLRLIRQRPVESEEPGKLLTDADPKSWQVAYTREPKEQEESQQVQENMSGALTLLPLWLLRESGWMKDFILNPHQLDLFSRRHRFIHWPASWLDTRVTCSLMRISTQPITGQVKMACWS